jgi:hypothetical protein
MTDNIEELKKQAAEAQQRAEKWQGIHAEATIKRELLAAAEQGEAYYAPQLLSFLMPNAKLVEADGKHVVRVVTTGEDGKEIHHTPAQAVAYLKQVKGMENLFRSAPAKSPAPAAAPHKIDWKKITPAQYREIREKHPEWVGLRPKR